MALIAPRCYAYEHQTISHYAQEHPDVLVWHWKNIPEIQLAKSGWSLADLRVTRTTDGVACEYGLDGLAYDPVTRAYTGIQCKYYTSAWITHHALSTFAATVFDCLAPANASRVGGGNDASYVNGVLYTPPSTRVHPRVTHSFKESFVHARIEHARLEFVGEDATSAAPAPNDDAVRQRGLELRDYQVEAVEKLLVALGGPTGASRIADDDFDDLYESSSSGGGSSAGDRDAYPTVACAGMPCGTGKTLVAAELALRLEERVVVVVSPLIALCEQNADRMGARFDGARAVARVWSGATAERRRGVKRDEHGDVIESVVERAAIELADAIERAFDAEHPEPLAIFVTFASARDVLGALGDRPFALVVDEAHNAPCDADVVALIKASTRTALFTATPTDELVIELCATIAYRMTLGEAIERGLVCDYELVIPKAIDLAQDGWEVQLSEFGGDDDREMVARCVFLAARMLLDGSRKCVVFCRTKDECRRLVRLFERVCVDHHAVRCCASVVVDETTRCERRAILARFAAAGEEVSPLIPDDDDEEDDDRSIRARRVPTLSIVAAVRVLDEGVDIPACDSVFFAHKPVATDSAMVRTVQRMCRANRLCPGKAPLMRAYIWASSYDVELAGALELLRAEDPQLSRKAVVRGCAYDSMSSWAGADAVESDDAELSRAFVERFKLSGVSFGDAAWQRILAALTAYRASNGHARVQTSHKTADGFKLGAALNRIRHAGIFVKDRLDRRASLDALGFAWDVYEERWQRIVNELRAYRTYTGHCRVPKNYTTMGGFKLGSAVHTIRYGIFVKDRADRLATLDALGFVWDKSDEDWRRILEALHAFKSLNGHCRVPAKHKTVDGLNIGNIVGRIRQVGAFVNERADRRAELDAIGFVWDPAEANWQRVLGALQVFHGATGHCRVPYNHITADGIRLYTRVCEIRHSQAHHVNDHPDRRQALDAIGFEWSPRRRHKASREEDWQRLVEALRDFHGQTGHCRVPKTYASASGFHLGAAISKIRSRDSYVKDRPDRRQTLDAMGFIWDARV